MYDFVTKSFLAGLASLVYKNLINQLLYAFGITDFLYRAAAANLVLPVNEINTPAGVLIGLFTDMVGLTWVALVIGYVIGVTDMEHHLLKGALVGASSWLVVYGFIMHSGILGGYQPSPIISAFTSIFLDLSAGMVMATVLKYLLEREQALLNS